MSSPGRLRISAMGVAAAALLVTAVAPVIASPAGARASAASRPPGPPTALTVDGLVSPIGLGLDDVQFAWHVNDARRGARQTAYRIVVSGPTGTPGWDSGRVQSADQAFIAYDGPALAPDSAYRWTVQTWAASGGPGPLAPPGTFETGLDDSDWSAEWIRRPTTDVLERQYDQYTFARKEFAVGPSPIVRARAYVSADQQYELYVNGTRAGKGEAYSFPDSQYYETLDVTGLLRPGSDNAVGAVYSWQGATKGHPAGAPGLIVQVSILHRDGSRQLITTDGTWRVRKGNWRPGAQRDLEGDQVDYVENIDGRAYPVGWELPGFDDGSWAPATVVGRPPVAPWSHLVSVRTRIVEAPVAAVYLTRLPSGSVVADFGQVIAAVPTVTFHHGVPGRLVTMRAGYLLDEPQPGHPLAGPPGEVSRDHGTQHTDMSYSYVERGGVETFRPFDYLGFRYLQIDDPGETLQPSDVVAMARHTAVPDENAGTFSSSDATVDAVFQLGRRSALYTAQEQFVDTPTREKGPWLWDGFNESQTAMDAFGEQNLTRKSLLEFAQSQSRYWPNGAINKIYPTSLGALDIAEFTEIYPEWVWQYWLHTGDRSLLAAVYPALSNLSDYVARAVSPATGLVTGLPATNVYSPLPVLTRQNVLGVDVFRRTADVAAALGRPAPEVTRQRRRQAALTAAVNARLTRPDGIYVDGLQANGAQAPTAAQDSNTVAVAYGVVPAARLGNVAAYVAGLGMASAPRDATELLETLRLGGRDADLLVRLTDPTTDGWANVLARGGTFTWEVWEPSDANGDSMSHGWGSNVLVEIQTALLGVRPTGPGYSTFDVSPPPTGLEQASGRVPTPRGPVSVAWRRPAGPRGAFTLDLTVPANATATVEMASPAGDALTDGTTPVTHAAGVRVLARHAGTATLAVGAGTYRFASSPPSRPSRAGVMAVALIAAAVLVGALMLAVVTGHAPLRTHTSAGASVSSVCSPAPAEGGRSAEGGAPSAESLPPGVIPHPEG